MTFEVFTHNYLDETGIATRNFSFVFITKKDFFQICV